MWDLNQPNNLAPNDQDCVEIGRKGFTPMTWNDQRCEVEARFICELPLGGNIAAKNREVFHLR